MQAPRETIIEALLNLVSGAAGFRTIGRRLQFPDQVTEQPAIFVRYLKDHYPERPTGLLPKTVMEAEIWIYATTGSPDAVPDAVLNPLIDAVEAALQPSPAIGAQTLGGLVVHCWIEGDILKEPGDLDDQAMAMIPVRLLAP